MNRKVCRVCNNDCMIVDQDRAPEKRHCSICWSALARVHELGEKTKLFGFSTEDWGGHTPHVTRSKEEEEVVLEWWGEGERKLTVYVHDNKPDHPPEGLALEFLRTWGPNIDSEMEHGVIGHGKWDFFTLWKWVWTGEEG